MTYTMRAIWLLLFCCARAALAAEVDEPLQSAERRLDVGAPFGQATLYMPSSTPKSVVIFLSGDGGWHLGVIDMARHLRDEGAAVVGLDVRHYLAEVAAGKDGACRYMAQDFETLAHRIEREMGLANYLHPLLYGYSSGATVAYAVLVQSPSGTFAGAVSLGFCPDQKFGQAALCPGTGPKLHYHLGDKGAWVFEPAPALNDRWVVFAGDADTVCPASVAAPFVEATGDSALVKLPLVGHGYGVEKNWVPQFRQQFNEMVAATTPAPITDPDVADLPLFEQPANGNAAAPLAVLLTGDGGWAGLDRGIASALNEQGIPLVALSSLKYFWQERTPDQTANDVARVMRHYLSSWQRQRVLLIGYSFGADVLPFVVNRLPTDLRARIQTVNLLGLSDEASFEIHVGGWIPNSHTGNLPLAPEVRSMQNVHALCLYGQGENNDPCARLAGGSLTAQTLGEGHHFGGEYSQLAQAILRFAGVSTTAQP